MLISAVQLTIVGVLVVYIFLIVLIKTIELMSNIITKYFPETQPAAAETGKDTESLVAAIVAAVKNRK